MPPNSNTKAGKTAIIRGLCSAYPTNEFFGFDDLMLLNETLGSNFSGVRKVVHPLYGDNNHLEGDGAIFSWKQMISPNNERQWVIKVMRQLNDLRLKRVLAESPNPQCCRCEAKENLTVDHMTLPFSEIAERFLLKFEHLPELEKDHENATWRFKDPGVAHHWRLHHDSMADYQILCRSCNSKKGNKQ